MYRIAQLISEKLQKYWAEYGHNRESTKIVIKAIEKGFQDQGIGVSITIQYDDNTYQTEINEQL